MEEDQVFLDFVVKGLVDHPEAVKVNRTVDEMGVLLTLDVHAEDMGKIIGRSGNTAKAIRTLLRVVGMKHNARVNLKINEPVGGLRSPEMVSANPAEATTPAEPAPVRSEATRSLDEAMADLNL
ncbi:MAG: KH domain-containing protein [Candidatus Pacebacteria bacterium]|nr:KH domain-containing protein [Candidatus Paceibacterota bacterium]